MILQTIYRIMNSSLVKFFCMFLFFAPSYAKYDRIETNDNFFFGRYKLGDEYKNIKNYLIVEEPSSCLIEGNNIHYVDCLFRDIDNVNYLVEGQVVIRKEININNYKGKELPFDLSKYDDLGTVLMKIFNKSKVDIMVGNSNSNISLSTGFILVNSLGELASFYIVFDNLGKIKKIGLRAEW